MTPHRPARLSLRVLAIAYVTILLLAPLFVVFWRTFEHGFGDAFDWMTTPAAVSALWLTLIIAVIAVPCNTVFGIACALITTRGRGRLGRWLDAILDLPFIVSPVVIGLALLLVYGQSGWLAPLFADRGIKIIYAVPGMVLATIFVSLPFVAREVTPVLREVGNDQEQAAATLGASSWQTFWRITLPSIRWGVAYGVVLSTARALGEIGAVLVVSSNVAGQTLTLPLLVYQRNEQVGTQESQLLTSVYAAATELAVISLVVLAVMMAFGSRRSSRK
jgi:sulfate transport system permease protein